jgi:OmpR-family two-component system manganese-sensing response regulator
MTRVLLVEDDPAVASEVQDWLIEAGYSVDHAAAGKVALNKLMTISYDLIVLDLILPDLNGLELCREYRKQGGSGRVIVVSGKSSTKDKESCLDAGADDYMTKPADLVELSARVRALMRRTLTISTRTLSSGDLEMDLDTYKVTRAGAELSLLPQELALLEFFMRHPNKVFSAETLRIRVWRGNSSLETVRTHIKTLRKKLELSDLPKLIKTVHGIGYALHSD